MTTTTFTELEVTTLSRLWNDPEWGQFLWRLSDRFEDDGDEDAARFIRWLHQWGQRPSDKNLFLTADGYWWWTADEGVVRQWEKAGQWGDGTRVAVLPAAFHKCCSGSLSECNQTDYKTPAQAVEAAMNCWRTFSEEQKVHLEENWRASQ